MRNRAKCKLCNSIIESYHSTDFVVCACNEIALDEGDAMKCFAKDWSNFVRVDDEGNEIVVKVVDKDHKVEPKVIPSKADVVQMLADLIKSYDNLPEHALTAPITHMDMHSALLIIYSIVKDI